jgi:solute carrier family 25 S-adenosylmethionine transporter 26
MNLRFLLLLTLSTSVEGLFKPTKDVIRNPRDSVKRHEPPPVLKQLVAGGLSRSLAQMALYPIDAMRTLAQTRDGRTLRDVGASALVRGCTTTSVFALFMGSIQFAVFGACRETVGPLLASAAGALGSCVISVPQEVIKQRLVTGVYTSFRQAVSTIYSNEGIPGFYNTWKPTMARNVPFIMTTFVAMDAIKTRRLKKTQKNDLSVVENLVIGMSSALVAVLITNPVDVIKTRLMTQAASVEVPYTSAIDCFNSIMAKEGPMTFFSGVKQRSVYVCTLWGVTFALNGKMKKYLADKNSP